MDLIVIFIIVLLFIVLLVALLAYMSGGLKRAYRAEVLKGLRRTNAMPSSIVTENDIAHLPLPVQKYLRYAGVIGKEKVLCIRAVFDGQMKNDPKRDWNAAKVEQYNFFDVPTRLFYMKLAMFGLPFVGLHSYTEALARMHIKAFGLITVLDSKGPEMRASDTVTLLNDMCVLAPATLIDKRIEWSAMDAQTAKATFENAGCKVSATLYFNEKGEMVDFITEDRYIIGMDNIPHKGVWSTPLKEYKNYNGLMLASSAEAIWLRPEGDYCYGRFTMKENEYNLKNLK